MDRKYTIVSIGEKLQPGADAIGGDKRLLKLGYTAEVVGRDSEGGLVCIAACPDLAAAEMIRHALEFLEGL